MSATPLSPLARDLPDGQAGGSGIVGSTFNFINSIIGAGIISLPYALSVAGPAPGVIILLVVTMSVDWTIGVLVRTGHQLQREQMLFQAGRSLNGAEGANSNSSGGNSSNTKDVAVLGRNAKLGKGPLYAAVRNQNGNGASSEDVPVGDIVDDIDGYGIDNEPDVDVDLDFNQHRQTETVAKEEEEEEEEGEEEKYVLDADEFSVGHKGPPLPNYQDLCERAFGPAGFYAVSLFQLVFAYGAMCAYSVIVGDTFPAVFRHWLGGDGGDGEVHGLKGALLKVLGSRHAVIALTTALVALPLSLSRSFKALERTSALSIAAIAFIVFGVAFSGSKLPADSPFRGPHKNMFSALGVFQSISVISFAFVCHHNTFLILASLRRPTLRRFRVVTHLSTATAVTFCLTLALVGYIIFGDASEGNILNNFPIGDTLINMCRLAFGFNMFLTYPLECIVCREVLACAWYRITSGGGSSNGEVDINQENDEDSYEMTDRRSNHNGAGSSRNYTHRANGSNSNGSGNEDGFEYDETLPRYSSMNASKDRYRDDDNRMSGDPMSPNLETMAKGTDLGDMGRDAIHGRQASMQHTKSSNNKSNNNNSSSNINNNDSKVQEPSYASSTFEISDRFHYISTLALVGSSLAVAESTCDLGAILEASGGLSATALAFILPPMCYMRIFNMKMSFRNKDARLPLTVIIFGLTVMAIATANTVRSILRGESKQCM